MVSLRDEEYRRVLQNNEKNITNSTNLSCLLPVLRTKGLLTENEFRLLQEMPEYEVRRRSQLVQTLQSKGGGNALNLFIEALQEETEHLGHKNLAITLLGEISSIKHAKKPAPPAPPRKARASFSQAPQPFSTPQPVRRHMTLHVPTTKERPQSTTEMDSEKISLPEKLVPKVILDVHQSDPQQRFLDNVYLSSQLKEIHAKLDANSNSHQTSLQIVHQLSTVIVDMQEKMVNMQQLLHSLIDNQQATEEECDISKRSNASNEAEDKGEDLDHDYVENPVNYMNSSSTNQSAEAQLYAYVQIGSSTTPKSEYTSLTKKRTEAVYENSPAQQKFNQADYVESKLLAHGHNGEYWLGVSKVDRSKVVIKKPAATVTTEILGQEVNALLKCKHPNVIQFIMADMSAPEQISLYFEYAEKGQLKSYLRGEKTNINLAKLLAMAANIACGMAELEKHKVIHCDLKASNILIDGDYLCKIASFNKAQCLKDNEKYRICDLYQISTRWQAPEVLSGRKFSSKSDVWSFGVLMAELFSYGSKPYPTMKVDEVKKFVLGKKKMPQPSGCPKEVYDIIKECFHHREDQRFPFTAVQKALKELHSKFFKKESDSSMSEFEED